MKRLPPLLLFCAMVNVSCAPQHADAPRAEAAGSFDYYLLNLSWAPEFCYSRPDSAECGGHFGFIVHGLWPQYSRGGYPENCGARPGPIPLSSMLDIMPDPRLIQHEWITHGTCTGLAAGDYFALIRRLFQALKIPPDFVAPARPFNLSPEEVKRDFEQANPSLTDADMAVSCGRGAYLLAVEICYSKDGRPTPCGGDIRDCTRRAIRVPKVP